MNRLDWLQPTPVVPKDVLKESTSRTSSKGSALIAAGLCCVATYTVYSIYQATHSLSRQALLPSNKSPLCLIIVNFPVELRGVFERSIRPMWSESELEIRYKPAVMFDETAIVTTETVASVVRREVLWAFDQHGGYPCMVYRTALSLNNEDIDPFMTVSPSVCRYAGSSLHQRHCVGYSVNGCGVRLLTHDVHGVFAPPNSPAHSAMCAKVHEMESRRSSSRPSQKSAHRNDDIESFLLHFRVFTPNSIASETKDSGAPPCRETGRAPEPAAVLPHRLSLERLWGGPAPIFAALGAALRYVRAGPEDCWGHEEPNDAAVAMVRHAWSFLRRDSRAAGNGSFGMAMQQMGVSAQRGGRFVVEVDVAGESGLVKLRFPLPNDLPLAHAFTELWRLAVFTSARGQHVLRHRLLVKVYPRGVKVAPNVRLLWPESLADAACRASFFTATQYFMEKDVRLEPHAAFFQIWNENVDDIFYVIAEYVTDIEPNS